MKSSYLLMLMASFLSLFACMAGDRGGDETGGEDDDLLAGDDDEPAIVVRRHFARVAVMDSEGIPRTYSLHDGSWIEDPLPTESAPTESDGESTDDVLYWAPVFFDGNYPDYAVGRLIHEGDAVDATPLRWGFLMLRDESWLVEPFPESVSYVRGLHREADGTWWADAGNGRPVYLRRGDGTWSVDVEWDFSCGNDEVAWEWAPDGTAVGAFFCGGAEDRGEVFVVSRRDGVWSRDDIDCADSNWGIIGVARDERDGDFLFWTHCRETGGDNPAVFREKDGNWIEETNDWDRSRTLWKMQIGPDGRPWLSGIDTVGGIYVATRDDDSWTTPIQSDEGFAYFDGLSVSPTGAAVAWGWSGERSWVVGNLGGEWESDDFPVDHGEWKVDDIRFFSDGTPAAWGWVDEDPDSVLGRRGAYFQRSAYSWVEEGLPAYDGSWAIHSASIGANDDVWMLAKDPGERGWVLHRAGGTWTEEGDVPYAFEVSRSAPNRTRWACTDDGGVFLWSDFDALKGYGTGFVMWREEGGWHTFSEENPASYAYVIDFVAR